jgi:hypothetical protein
LRIYNQEWTFLLRKESYSAFVESRDSGSAAAVGRLKEIKEGSAAGFFFKSLPSDFPRFSRWHTKPDGKQF